ncbi:hypothetical protein SAMN04488498_113108 [Mesorhizobium albiziae]|uniref:GYD domain-containing protein n=1 Tax=Neomesorhizobium albiziae TaxID=335020 RepID=A0A1I4CMP8_9HYPH|nr:hypothetical protein [Mesorhizobium albiziae]GLS29306.1 hypothetical protein GCM10007937_10140 [Mesorhizobium albiziae]SFK81346.1 hypothetical protein SAMN04488498_113108 [Mesorhizobium albiziae]
MADYWVTFRIASDSTYNDRYGGMVKAMAAMRGSQNASWAEPTSFWLVQSASGLDALVKALTAPLNAKTDILVARNMNDGHVRYFGELSRPDVLKLFFPSMKKVP